MRLKKALRYYFSFVDVVEDEDNEYEIFEAKEHIVAFYHNELVVSVSTQDDECMISTLRGRGHLGEYEADSDTEIEIFRRIKE